MKRLIASVIAFAMMFSIGASAGSKLRPSKGRPNVGKAQVKTMGMTVSELLTYLEDYLADLELAYPTYVDEKEYASAFILTQVSDHCWAEIHHEDKQVTELKIISNVKNQTKLQSQEIALVFIGALMATNNSVSMKESMDYVHQIVTLGEDLSLNGIHYHYNNTVPYGGDVLALIASLE